MKKTEREMLVLAAKAAGMPWDRWVEIGDDSWNPLEDDGDALRLAVKLRLTVMVWSDGGCVSAARTTPDGAPSSSAGGWQAAFARGDIASATRRAIVLAAAEIGESMP